MNQTFRACLKAHDLALDNELTVADTQDEEHTALNILHSDNLPITRASHRINGSMHSDKFLRLANTCITCML